MSQALANPSEEKEEEKKELPALGSMRLAALCFVLSIVFLGALCSFAFQYMS